jgi:hypothetical protein
MADLQFVRVGRKNSRVYGIPGVKGTFVVKGMVADGQEYPQTISVDGFPFAEPNQELIDRESKRANKAAGAAERAQKAQERADKAVARAAKAKELAERLTGKAKVTDNAPVAAGDQPAVEDESAAAEHEQAFPDGQPAQ